MIWIIKWIGPPVLSAAITSAAMAYDATVLFLLWTWLAVPHLSAPSIGYGDAFTVCVFIEFVRVKFAHITPAKEQATPVLVARLFNVLALPLLLGFILSRILTVTT